MSALLIACSILSLTLLPVASSIRGRNALRLAGALRSAIDEGVFQRSLRNIFRAIAQRGLLKGIVQNCAR